MTKLSGIVILVFLLCCQGSANTIGLLHLDCQLSLGLDILLHLSTCVGSTDLDLVAVALLSPWKCIETGMTFSH